MKLLQVNLHSFGLQTKDFGTVWQNTTVSMLLDVGSVLMLHQLILSLAILPLHYQIHVFLLFRELSVTN